MKREPLGVKQPDGDEAKRRNKGCERVRDDEMAPVDDRDAEQCPAKPAGGPNKPAVEREHRPQRDQRRGDLDQRIADADPGAAVAAAATQEQPREYRNQVDRAQCMSTGGAARAAENDAVVRWQSGDERGQEAAGNRANDNKQPCRGHKQ